MIHDRLITENHLDEFVRANAEISRGLIPELIYRLACPSAPKATVRRFPLKDSISQHGPDGELDSEDGFEPFIPKGHSIWEIGTGLNAHTKATSDYNDSVTAIPTNVRKESTFIFVTLLSARRDWEYSWKDDSQADWLADRRKRGDWKDVRILDGTKLIDWVVQFPGVERWLAHSMGLPTVQIETLEQHWLVLQKIGDPPPLSAQVFLMNRGAACSKLKDLVLGNAQELKLDTHFHDQVVDFISACLSTLDEPTRMSSYGRCLIISGSDAWNAMATLKTPLILIADFDLDNDAATKLLTKAKRAGHAVIYGGSPGGIPHPNRASIPSPKSYQLQDALEKSGYAKERARTLAHKSDGNLSTLLRCLHNLSSLPEWAQGTVAAELKIAELLGGWNEDSKEDKAAVETLLGKGYGEWIETMREIALRPGTPLIHHNGTWKFVSRYEGWYTLGPQIFDEHLDRLKDVAIRVLGECDPKFELSPDQRFAASIHGKRRLNSVQLRKGLADTLALLGSHPKALISCSPGKAELISILVVRELLANADWKMWASLDGVIHLLAEAAPGEFLDAVEKCLLKSPSPIEEVFKQEGEGIFGSTYMCGLLWALETLAWDPDYLIRVVVILGDLASKDPGGKWANRPANSLSEILLPWYPQTCASISKRRTAIATLLSEFPEVGWSLLLRLLPQSSQSATCSAKPSWRNLIPEDWKEGISGRDYWEQIDAYAEIAIGVAKQDAAKLGQLIDRLDDLPEPARKQLLAHLVTDAVRAIPHELRLQLWNRLVDLVARHKKYRDATWAISSAELDEIASIAEQLAPESPVYRHRRLFTEQDFDLFEENGDFELQTKRLEQHREKAVSEIFTSNGLNAVIDLGRAVESPWRVGMSLGAVAPDPVDSEILPSLLDSKEEPLVHFVGGYTWSRFRKLGWAWVDRIIASDWTPAARGLFLAFLPFDTEAWERVSHLLAEDESFYWTKTNANPYNTKGRLEGVIDCLLKYDRVRAALGCLQKMIHTKEPINNKQAVRVIEAAMHSFTKPNSMDARTLVEVIKALQEDEGTNQDDLFKIEWNFLPLLDRHNGATPKISERRLAQSSEFFCEVIRAIFRSDNEERPLEEPTDQQKNIASNAYRLLHYWQSPPGQQKDGTFKGEDLTKWIGEVEALCNKTGHFGVAMSHIGHVLVYAPQDPDGLWLHHSAASVLNAKDAERMREGFRMELYNSRGVHSFSAGAEERALASKYRANAEAVESRGYHRLAKTLRGLAESYERDAERESANDPFED